MRDQLSRDYFEWLYSMMTEGRLSPQISYRELFWKLHDTEFTYIIPKDANRAKDGIGMRRRFAISIGQDGLEDEMLGPCSVLEMIIALAVRCEETIMDDPSYGDRTGQWFWIMMANLGLGAMYGRNYDEDKATYIIDRFLNREYKANGVGGLFKVRRCDADLRDVEIWVQLLWYLDSIYI